MDSLPFDILYIIFSYFSLAEIARLRLVNWTVKKAIESYLKGMNYICLTRNSCNEMAIDPMDYWYRFTPIYTNYLLPADPSVWNFINLYCGDSIELQISFERGWFHSKYHPTYFEDLLPLAGKLNFIYCSLNFLQKQRNEEKCESIKENRKRSLYSEMLWKFTKLQGIKVNIDGIHIAYISGFSKGCIRFDKFAQNYGEEITFFANRLIMFESGDTVPIGIKYLDLYCRDEIDYTHYDYWEEKDSEPISINLTNYAASTLVELRISGDLDPKCIKCQFPSLKRLHIYRESYKSKNTYEFLKAFESSWSQLESFVLISESDEDFEYFSIFSLFTKLKEFRLETRPDDFLITRNAELKLLSSHLRRVTIEIQCFEIKLKITSNKLYYLSLGSIKFPEVDYNSSNLRFLEQEGSLFDMLESKLTFCRFKLEPEINFVEKLAIENYNQDLKIVLPHYSSYTQFFSKIDFFSDFTKSLHCSFDQLSLMQVLKFLPHNSELMVYSTYDTCDSMILQDKLHRLLLKLINRGLLVKYYLPWICRCESDCPLKTIKPKFA